MSQGNTSVSERLLWRKETLKKWPEKLGGEWGGVHRKQHVQRSWGETLGIGNQEKAEHMRREMHRGVPPLIRAPSFLFLTPLLQLEGRQSSSQLNSTLACTLQ